MQTNAHTGRVLLADGSVEMVQGGGRFCFRRLRPGALLLTIEDEQARTIAQNEFIGVYGKSADVLADKFDPALAFATELVRRIA